MPLHLTVILSENKCNSRLEEFAIIQRKNFTKKEFVKELNDSRRHLLNMRDKFGGNRVEILSSARLPMFPIIMIDDTLIIGHYAHSYVPAPMGLWITLQHPKIGRMYEDILQGKDIRKIYRKPTEKSILRYVEELATR